MEIIEQQTPASSNQNPLNLYKALAEFQNLCPVIEKQTKGHGYKYADMATIVAQIAPFLKQVGLGFTQPIVGGSVITIIFHIESGEKIQSSIDIFPEMELMKMNKLQVLGSQITTLKRYALSSILGIVTDCDTDGFGAPKQIAKKGTQVEKPKLNEKQFIRAVGGIQSNEYTKEYIKTKYDLNEQQILTIDEMNV
jgi:hypothetical protein